MLCLHFLDRLGDSADASRVRARLQASSLRSDMAAFKAANPGAVIEDFVRPVSFCLFVFTNVVEGAHCPDTARHTLLCVSMTGGTALAIGLLRVTPGEGG